MLSIKTAAVKAEVSEALVRGWVADGLLAHYRMGAKGSRGRIYIRESDLEALVESFRVQPDKPPAILPPPPLAVKFKHLKL